MPLTASAQAHAASAPLDHPPRVPDINVMTTPLPAGTPVALATLHGKERALRPALARIGLDLRVAAIDTDALGTFSGEVDRRGTMREVATEKARRGADALGLRYGLASEATFGPDPDMPIVAAGYELLVFLDRETGHAIVESARTDTSFAHLVVTPDADIDGFLARIGFPDHAVIVRPHADRQATPNRKGLLGRAEVDAALRDLAVHAPLRIETDMRAHLNPTRMTALSQLAVRLADRLATPCPACAAPGFGRINVARGLPCGACGTATPMVRAVVFACAVCGHQEERQRSDGAQVADPAQCPLCNP